MLSSEKNIDRIVALFKESKEYAEMRLEYAKLDATGKISAALSATILFVVLFVIGAIFIVLLSCTTAFLLSHYVTHDHCTAFAIVSGVYLVLAAVVYRMRKKWIVNPVSRLLGTLLLAGPDDAQTP
ncbi:MAG: phage holin family protein [Bacteroidaceae bacterium]|nr:phage holin family protein [Bacteroidaceae bacterium]